MTLDTKTVVYACLYWVSRTSLDIFKLLNGGAKGDRTPDLDNAIVALSQLSYGPTHKEGG